MEPDGSLVGQESDVNFGNVANLDQFAAAGGTGVGPFIVDGTGVNTQAEFLAAMQAIRGAALPCVFDVPTPTSGDFDAGKVNVDYDPGDGNPVTPPYQVPDGAACAGAGGGWYYDDPAAPANIELCEATCSTVTSQQTGSVSITLGCTTRIK